MKLHANAALSLNKRRLLCERVVEREWTLTKAAELAHPDPLKDSRDRRQRHLQQLGELGLLDRPSSPATVANRTCERRIQVIVALRRLRFTGPEIAETLAMPVSTVSGILHRVGMGKLGRLGLEPAARYERARPGELIHIDVKKLGRIARPGHRMLGQQARAVAGHHRAIYNRGWEFVHVAVDDCTRLAYVEVLDDEKATTATAFLRRAVAFYRRHGITVERLITDG